MGTESEPVDQWRVRLDSIDQDAPGTSGLPPAMITLEVKITRRVTLVAGNSEGAYSRLTDLGLGEVSELLVAMDKMSLPLRELISTDWRDADPPQFSMKQLTSLCMAAEQLVTWKFEGDFSSDTAVCVAIFNCGGYEVRQPFTQAQLPLLEQRANDRLAIVEAALADPQLAAADKPRYTAEEVLLRCQLKNTFPEAKKCFAAYHALKAAETAEAKKQAQKGVSDAKKGGTTTGCDGEGFSQGRVPGGKVIE